MKKFLELIFVFFVLISCDISDSNKQNDQKVNLELNIPTYNIPNEVQSMDATLVRDDYADIYAVFTIEENSAVASFQSVFSGVWHLTVNAYDQEGSLIYSGETNVNIQANEDNIVYLNLDPVTGSLTVIITWGENDTVNVPNDYPTIQDAIDSCEDGQTIEVDEGLYNESINFNGKALTIKSVGEKENTIISGNDSSSVVEFSNNEDGNSKLIGFTIKNGSNIRGGGIQCSNSSPVLENLIIKNNHADDDGGGIWIGNTDAPVVVEKCVIKDNTANDNGGGIHMLYGNAIIRNSYLTGNISYAGSAAIDLWSSDPLIINSALVENISYGWGAIGFWNESYPTLINNIIAYNNGYGIVMHQDANPIIRYCNFYENSSGLFWNDNSPEDFGEIVQENNNSNDCDIYFNIFENPLLEIQENVYILLDYSPCIDAGVSDGYQITDEDLVFNTRIVGNFVDIGAIEDQE